MTNFHDEREHKDNAAGDQRHGERDLAVGDGHVRMHAAKARHHNGTDDGKKQTHGEREQSADEGHEQYTDRDAVPAGWA